MKDLHIHTCYSDGEFNEFEIIEKVKEAGINEFSICDHDTIEGTLKVDNLVKDNSLKHHKGVELSSRIKDMYNGVDTHLLYRDFDENDPVLLALIDKISDFRRQKTDRMLKLVKQFYNVEITKEEIDEVAKTTNSIGKPHVYALLLKRGVFDREEFYANMRTMYDEDLKVEAKDIIRELKDSKGYITLAHPIEIMRENNLSYTDVDAIVASLKECGLDGLETRHSKHSEEDYLEFSKIAKKYDLVETCGSDYHGPRVKPSVKLGVCVKNRS